MDKADYTIWLGMGRNCDQNKLLVNPAGAAPTPG